MSSARRAASVILGLALAAASLKLVACSDLNPTPPNPHEDDSDADTLGPLRSAIDASDASEEPP